jgi:hypothetical protein
MNEIVIGVMVVAYLAGRICIQAIDDKKKRRKISRFVNGLAIVAGFTLATYLF